MLNLRKRVCAIVLSVVMCLSLLPMSAKAYVMDSKHEVGLTGEKFTVTAETVDVSGETAEIATAGQFLWFMLNMNQFAGKTVNVTTDEIDLGGYEFRQNKEFVLPADTIFNGNGVTIKNFWFYTTNVNGHERPFRPEVDRAFVHLVDNEAPVSEQLTVHSFYVLGQMNDVTFDHFDSVYHCAYGMCNASFLWVGADADSDSRGSISNVALTNGICRGSVNDRKSVPSSFIYIEPGCTAENITLDHMVLSSSSATAVDCDGTITNLKLLDTIVQNKEWAGDIDSVSGKNTNFASAITGLGTFDGLEMKNCAIQGRDAAYFAGYDGNTGYPVINDLTEFHNLYFTESEQWDIWDKNMTLIRQDAAKYGEKRMYLQGYGMNSYEVTFGPALKFLIPLQNTLGYDNSAYGSAKNTNNGITIVTYNEDEGVLYGVLMHRCALDGDGNVVFGFNSINFTAGTEMEVFVMSDMSGDYFETLDQYPNVTPTDYDRTAMSRRMRWFPKMDGTVSVTGEPNDRHLAFTMADGAEIEVYADADDPFAFSRVDGFDDHFTFCRETKTYNKRVHAAVSTTVEPTNEEGVSIKTVTTTTSTIYYSNSSLRRLDGSENETVSTYKVITIPAAEEGGEATTKDLLTKQVTTVKNYVENPSETDDTPLLSGKTVTENEYELVPYTDTSVENAEPEDVSVRVKYHQTIQEYTAVPKDDGSYESKMSRDYSRTNLYHPYVMSPAAGTKPTEVLYDWDEKDERFGYVGEDEDNQQWLNTSRTVTQKKIEYEEVEATETENAYWRETVGDYKQWVYKLPEGGTEPVLNVYAHDPETCNYEGAISYMNPYELERTYYADDGETVIKYTYDSRRDKYVDGVNIGRSTTFVQKERLEGDTGLTTTVKTTDTYEPITGVWPTGFGYWGDGQEHLLASRRTQSRWELRDTDGDGEVETDPVEVSRNISTNWSNYSLPTGTLYSYLAQNIACGGEEPLVLSETWNWDDEANELVRTSYYTRRIVQPSARWVDELGYNAAPNVRDVYDLTYDAQGRVTRDERWIQTFDNRNRCNNYPYEVSTTVYTEDGEAWTLTESRDYNINALRSTTYIGTDANGNPVDKYVPASWTNTIKPTKTEVVTDPETQEETTTEVETGQTTTQTITVTYEPHDAEWPTQTKVVETTPGVRDGYKLVYGRIEKTTVYDGNAVEKVQTGTDADGKPVYTLGKKLIPEEELALLPVLTSSNKAAETNEQSGAKESITTETREQVANENGDLETVETSRTDTVDSAGRQTGYSVEKENVTTGEYTTEDMVRDFAAHSSETTGVNYADGKGTEATSSFYQTNDELGGVNKKTEYNNGDALLSADERELALPAKETVTAPNYNEDGTKTGTTSTTVSEGYVVLDENAETPEEKFAPTSVTETEKSGNTVVKTTEKGYTPVETEDGKKEVVLTSEDVTTPRKDESGKTIGTDVSEKDIDAQTGEATTKTYSTVTKEVPVLDEDGNETGETEKVEIADPTAQTTETKTVPVTNADGSKGEKTVEETVTAPKTDEEGNLLVDEEGNPTGEANVKKTTYNKDNSTTETNYTAKQTLNEATGEIESTIDTSAPATQTTTARDGSKTTTTYKPNANGKINTEEPYTVQKTDVAGNSTTTVVEKTADGSTVERTYEGALTPEEIAEATPMETKLVTTDPETGDKKETVYAGDAVDEDGTVKEGAQTISETTSSDDGKSVKEIKDDEGNVIETVVTETVDNDDGTMTTKETVYEGSKDGIDEKEPKKVTETTETDEGIKTTETDYVNNTTTETTSNYDGTSQQDVYNGTGEEKDRNPSQTTTVDQNDDGTFTQTTEEIDPETGEAVKTTTQELAENGLPKEGSEPQATYAKPTLNFGAKGTTDEAKAAALGNATVTFENDNKSIHVTNDVPCVVYAKLANGSYRRIEGSPRGANDYTFDVASKLADVTGGYSLEVVKKGDITGEGSVDVGDITKLIRAKAQKEDGLTERERAMSDVNGDGVINLDDITALIRCKSASAAKPMDW